MQRIVTCLAATLALVGCAASHPPTFTVDGYARIPIPPGCYGSKSDRTVQLGPELHRQLVGLLRDPPSGLMCWHARRDGTLLLTIGPGCGLHREAEFRRLSATWTLKEERNNIMSECFIRCDEGSAKYCAV